MSSEQADTAPELEPDPIADVEATADHDAVGLAVFAAIDELDDQDVELDPRERYSAAEVIELVEGDRRARRKMLGDVAWRGLAARFRRLRKNHAAELAEARKDHEAKLADQLQAVAEKAVLAVLKGKRL